VLARRDASGWSLLERVQPNAQNRMLLLPGLFCSAAFYTDVLADPLLEEAGVTAIAADPPGFAGRPVPKGFDYSIEGYAALVEEFAGRESIGLIVGHSLSANICIEVAARHRFRGPLLLLSPSLSADDEEKDTRSLNDASRTPVVRTLVWMTIDRMLRKGMRDRLPADRRDELLAEMTRNPHAASRAQLIACFDHMAAHGGLAQRLATAQSTVWVGRGDRDEVAISDEERRWLDEGANVELKTIPGAGHFSITDNPHEVSRLAIELLQSGRSAQLS
jgi:pimeloyl-ACP methyl ester carboxylesterase